MPHSLECKLYEDRDNTHLFPNTCPVLKNHQVLKKHLLNKWWMI